MTNVTWIHALLVLTFCVAVPALVLGAMAYADSQNTTVTVSTVTAQKLSGGGSPINLLDALQYSGPSSETFTFGATTFNGDVTLAAPQASASPVNLMMTSGTLSAGNVEVNGAPIVQVIATSNTNTLTSTTKYIDVFTAATSTTGSPNAGFSVPSNFEGSGTLVIEVFGRQGAAPSSVPVLYVQCGQDATAVNVLGAITSSAGKSFATTITLSTISPTVSYLSYTTNYASGGGTNTTADSTSMGPLTVGGPVNVYLAPTTAAGDGVIYHAYARYCPSV